MPSRDSRVVTGAGLALALLGGCGGDPVARRGAGPDAGGDAAPVSASPPCPAIAPDRCGAACVDLDTSLRNCGACGNACTGGAVCAAASCVCPGAVPDRCGDACVDTAADPAHCGACEAACRGLCEARRCGEVQALALGGQHSLFRLADGRVLATGHGGFGQLAEDVPGRAAPALVPGLAGVVAVGAGRAHSCFVVGEGEVLCAGDNAFGQVLAGDALRAVEPRPIALPEPARALSAGGRHTCALGESGGAYCWGWGGDGQLGDGQPGAFRDAPATVALPGPAGAIRAGGAHSCALLADGAVVCWGDNDSGQIGDGTEERRPAPVPVALPEPAVALATGDRSTCAVTAESGVHCWGRLPAAGDAGSARSLRPVRIVELDGAVEVALGDTLACARLAGGTVTCAGAAAPDAGTGGFEPVPGVERADALFAGGRHACALSPGSARCWGDGAEGQLGTGERASWAAASAVSFR